MAPRFDLATKAELRKQLISRRAALSAPVKARFDAALRRHIIEQLHRHRPTVVAAYAPMVSEPLGNHTTVGESFLPGLLADPPPTGLGITTLLPMWLPGNSLSWRTYGGDHSLTMTKVGLLEPHRSSPTAPLAEADLVIVPALAVDVTGRRLGRGAGCYDRALTEARALVVAVVFDDELTDELPAEPHDVRVNAVITPKHGWRELS